MKSKIEFLYKQEDIKRHFVVETDFSVLKENGFLMDIGNVEYPVLEYENTDISEIINGQKVAFEPVAQTWSGKKVTVATTLRQITEAYLRSDIDYEFIFIDDSIKKVLYYYMLDNLCVLDEKTFPKRLLRYEGEEIEWYRLCELTLVTDRFVYYSDEAGYLMFSFPDMKLLEAGGFAENEYYNSIERLKQGTEVLKYVHEAVVEQGKEYGICDFEMLRQK